MEYPVSLCLQASVEVPLPLYVDIRVKQNGDILAVETNADIELTVELDGVGFYKILSSEPIFIDDKTFLSVSTRSASINSCIQVNSTTEIAVDTEHKTSGPMNADFYAYIRIYP